LTRKSLEIWYAYLEIERVRRSSPRQGIAANRRIAVRYARDGVEGGAVLWLRGAVVARGDSHARRQAPNVHFRVSPWRRSCTLETIGTYFEECRTCDPAIDSGAPLIEVP
jgi:hypothetical protein